MIVFKNTQDSIPYKKFKYFYNKATENNQENIEAVAISSYDPYLNEVDSRYVNLKYIIDDQWIFFSNYNSNKSFQFNKHPNISSLFFWNSIDIQIRIKAFVQKVSDDISDRHFQSRDIKKNALAISSSQSKKILNYEKVLKNYNKTFNDIKSKTNPKRPKYWGGYQFTPYVFEFWEGQESRINKREIYELKKNKWVSYFLEP